MKAILLRVVTVGLLATSLTVAAKPTPAVTGRAPSTGVELFYHGYGDGDGPPLLVLNGGPGVSSAHFAFLAGQLAGLDGGRRVILFDQRGTGRSKLGELDETTVNLELMVEDIEALRRHLGVEAWTVMGHSWGGMYAMAYAVAHPGRVNGLILSASGGSNLDWLAYVGANLQMRLGPERRERYLHWNDPDVIAEDPEKANLERVRAMAAAYVYDPDNMPAVVAALSAPGANDPRVRGLVYDDLERRAFDVREELGDFPAPALILHGRQDLLGELVPWETWRALPDAELVWINECGHYLWLDQPESYFAAIDRFLAGLPATRAD